MTGKTQQQRQGLLEANTGVCKGCLAETQCSHQGRDIQPEGHSSYQAPVKHQQLAVSLCQVLGQLLEVDGTSSTTCQRLVKNLQQQGSHIAQAVQL